jgi:hypothetical protein
MLWAVPVNMTEAGLMTRYIHESIEWARIFAKELPLLGGGHTSTRKTWMHGKHHASGGHKAGGKQQRRRLQAEAGEGEGQAAGAAMQALHPSYQQHMLL